MISALGAALVIEPNHASTLDDLAHVVAARGDVDEALRIQRRALLAAPDRQDLRRRYDALLVKLPVGDGEFAAEIIVDVKDAGTSDPDVPGP